MLGGCWRGERLLGVGSLVGCEVRCCWRYLIYELQERSRDKSGGQKKHKLEKERGQSWVPTGKEGAWSLIPRDRQAYEKHITRKSHNGYK